MFSTRFETEGSSSGRRFTYSYDIVCFTCISISRLVGRRACSLLPTRRLILMHLKHTIS